MMDASVNRLERSAVLNTFKENGDACRPSFDL
jgi:hypothetical protein